MTVAKRSLFLVLLLLLIAAGSYGYRTVKLGAQAYLYGYPLVLMELTRQAMKEESPANRFDHKTAFPDHTFRTVVRPNNDTLYSIAWLDLAREPLVLSVPDMADRYYVMPLMDAWTNVFATVGKRSYGTEAGNYLVAGPRWQGVTPAGMERITAPTDMVWIIGRIQTDGRDDIPNVAALQRQFSLVPMSRFADATELPGTAVADERPPSTSASPSRQIEAMSGAEFFALLSVLMAKHPPAPEDAPMLKDLARIGISPRVALHANKPGPFDSVLLTVAKGLAGRLVKKRLERGGTLENGWAVQRDTIGNYGINYAVRAAVAMIGLGALPPAEAAYPNTSVDSEGRDLSGSHRYRLHFPAGQAPPVNAFWSLTMYDEEGFLVNNSIGRYSLGDRDPLAFNEDGSLDLLIQHDTPAAAQSNWLPAPQGKFALTLRIYLPREEFLDGSWKLPAVERLQ